MRELHSYLRGEWTPGTGDPIQLFDPSTEEVLATTKAVEDVGSAMAWGRDVGGPTLRALTFAERAALLDAMAKSLHEHREELIAIAIANGGNTRGDAKFDIDGATAALSAYAALGEEIGARRWLLDGDAAPIFRGSKIRAQHVQQPRHGLAVHINAYNFPAWGMFGKAAVALLAGMPVLSKPATSTSMLAHRMIEIIAEAGVLPPGAFQLMMGPPSGLLEGLGSMDVVAFTGSAGTGARIRGHENVLARGVRVNVEADSLNAVILGPDVEQGSELFDLVVRDLTIEMTQKAGQKCTATRRIIVPQSRLEDLRTVLAERLDDVAGRTGNPADKGHRMGPLNSARQLADAREGVSALATAAEIVRGDPQRSEFGGVEAGKGYFLDPILLQASPEAALDGDAPFHQTEVFGPVATLLPYDGEAATAAKIVALGQGSLVSTVYSDDREFLEQAVREIGPFLGRLVVANEKVAGASMSPGCVFPVVNHGGPGRAGSGSELGGLPGMFLYMQRTAVQGGASQIARLLDTKK